MQEMIHCLHPSILEGQRAQLQWQQQQQQKQQVNSNFCMESFFSLQSEGLGDGWPNLNTSSQYPIAMREKEEVSTTITSATISNSTSSAQVGKLAKSSKKRKVADKKPPMGSSDEEEKVEKRIKDDSGNGSKEKNEDKKRDYIHVRARRGEATDSHSLAERVRRERISERMKYLEGLVPGCNKISGKAGMLDEIINYVQSLQRQVEFLSMKLAAVNPRLDHINMETLFNKEINLPCNSNISSVGMSPELLDPTFNQFNSLPNMAMNQTEPFLDPCFNVQRNNSGWDPELHNLYGSAFSFHSLQGNLLPSNLKREL